MHEDNQFIPQYRDPRSDQAAQCAKEMAACSDSNQLGGLQNRVRGLERSEPRGVVQAMEIVEKDKQHRSLAADQALMLTTLMNGGLSDGLQLLADGINTWMNHQGFNSNDKPTEIALMHSELSEMLEGVRNGIPRGMKGGEEEELADLIIRALHYAGKYRINIGYAILKKQLENYQRPYKHGKTC